MAGFGLFHEIDPVLLGHEESPTLIEDRAWSLLSQIRKYLAPKAAELPSLWVNAQAPRWIRTMKLTNFGVRDRKHQPQW